MLYSFKKEFKTNLRLAFPIMMGQLGHVLVGLVDNLMVGRLGAAPLAAISLGNGLVFIAMAIGLGFSFAITPLIAESDGKSDTQAGQEYLKHGLVLCGLGGIVLCGLLYLAKPILFEMNQPIAVVKLAIPYLNIVALSMFPLMLFQALKQFSDGLAQTKYAMYATLAANVLNVILNYILIYGFWQIPALGLEGAAIGTVVARIFMVILLYLFISKKRKFRKYLNGITFTNFNLKPFQRLLKLGFPTALQVLFEVAIFTASIFLAGMLGTKQQAANQIALNLASMTFMIAFGLNVAATIRVGNQKGKENYIELRRIAFSIFLLVFFIEVVFAIGFVIFRNVLPQFYINDTIVITIAIQLLLIASWFQISDGLQTVFLGALRGLQDVRIPTVICFIAYWLIGFPASYYLSQYTELEAGGIWIGLLIGLSVAAVLLFLRFNYVSKELLYSNGSVSLRN